MSKLIWFLLGAALGAGLIHYLDCQRGKERRSRMSHHLMHASDSVRKRSVMASHEVGFHLKQLGEIKDGLVSEASARGRRAAQATARRVGR